MEIDLIAIDTETGGVYPAVNPLLSIGAVASWDAEPLILYVRPEPGKIISPEAAKINGYTPELWAARCALSLPQAMLFLAAQLEFWLREKKGARLVAHNAGFDRSFLEEAARPCDIDLPGRYAWRCSMMLMATSWTKGCFPRAHSALPALASWPASGPSMAAPRCMTWLKTHARLWPGTSGFRKKRRGGASMRPPLKNKPARDNP